MTTTDDTLAERQKTHGEFAVNAHVSQKIKRAIRSGGWSCLSTTQIEALDLIATKIGRIMSGNPNEPDHWRDIAGYARLAEKELEK